MSWIKFLAVFIVWITFVTNASIVGAGENDSSAPIVAKKEISTTAGQSWQHAFRGTTLSYLNTASALTLRRDAELTYNPYYAMSLSLAPQYWLNNIFYLAGFFAMTRELSEADNTTYSREIQLHDSFIKGAAAKFWTIPGAKIDLSFSLSSIFPTSKQSRARTMILGVKPEILLTRNFDWLEGFSLSYQLGGTKFFNKYTTAQTESSIIPNCVAGTRSCDSFLNTGVRNTEWRLVNTLNMSLNFTKWIGASIRGGIIIDWLYEIEKSAEENISWQAQKGSDRRHTMVFGAEVYGKPVQPLTVALGVNTVNPQLTPDSEYEVPFVNRYTAIYLDLRLEFESFVNAISRKKENKI